MSARDRQLKVEQYAEENKRLRQAIGTLTMLNADLQNQLNQAQARISELEETEVDREHKNKC